MHQALFIVITIAAFGFLFYNLKRLYTYLKVGKPDQSRFENVSERINNMLAVAFGQSKIFRDQSAGVVHALIFWGFLTLLFSASEAVIQGIFPTFSWHILGPLNWLITLAIDIFCLLVIISIIIAFYRRYILKVPRLQGDADEMKDAAIVLSAIFIIVTSHLLQNASLTAIYPNEPWAIRPISTIISWIIPFKMAVYLYEYMWWVHILAIYAFMNYLPYSKHMHVYSSIPNVYFSSFTPVNKLQKIDFEEEGVEKFGVVDIDDLTWKNLLDGYSCTHCGRCTSVCPANLTGKELSPREIIVQTRHRTIDFAPVMLRQKAAANPEEVKLTEAEQALAEKKFVGDYQSVEALWQCTTCAACMQECPINIEHVPAIVGMRRSLVMMEANFPQLLQSAFSNLETNSSPWAFSQAERADWAEGLDIPTAASNPDFDVLFWVGCAGSFDDRAKKVSVAFAKLLKKAGVNFAILGTEEQCNGDVARRAGNEYLADMLVKMNIDTLNRYNVKKIVTFCPHCFNTMKNEYPDFGGKYEVIHHTDFLLDLIKQGKLETTKNSETYSYHDSCYLGRYNSLYESPRKILQHISSTSLKEADRNKDKGFCCGAGGAQMFMEETEGKRVNIERSEELIALGAKTIALNCPFCMTMITDGVKAKDLEDVHVKDIAEILLENVK